MKCIVVLLRGNNLMAKIYDPMLFIFTDMDLILICSNFINSKRQRDSRLHVAFNYPIHFQLLSLRPT